MAKAAEFGAFSLFSAFFLLHSLTPQVGTRVSLSLLPNEDEEEVYSFCRHVTRPYSGSTIQISKASNPPVRLGQTSVEVDWELVSAIDVPLLNRD